MGGVEGEWKRHRKIPVKREVRAGQHFVFEEYIATGCDFVDKINEIN